ncbi:DUF4030 domain-containing protein [Psychrobacillus vulpis]|uniref:DUF4030 domain-containing protein n=1 Tax=Psychrobacillus vulpis TaxID=2325572 RepID=A0A544TPL4_9BACI|nr:DUF4030 domain-containing protein [Psychrobacillus vulpis]TQR19400.1 DUF4030 domain-containing protein [Psychrobacillus vulpis]
MLKRILIIAGILIVGIASFSLLNKSLEADTAVANKEEQKPLFTKEEQLNISTLNTVTEIIHEKYEELEFVVSSNSEIELRIQVKENEKYFNSVKKDLESIAKSVIKSSTLKDYTVVVERLDLSIITEEQKNINKELLLLTKTLMEGLKEDYEVIENINTDSLTSITIHTSIKGLDKDAHKLAMEIEETVNEILHSKELNSVSHIDSYEIRILNAKGEVVN